MSEARFTRVVSPVTENGNGLSIKFSDVRLQFSSLPDPNCLASLLMNWLIDGLELWNNKPHARLHYESMS